MILDLHRMLKNKNRQCPICKLIWEYNFFLSGLLELRMLFLIETMVVEFQVWPTKAHIFHNLLQPCCLLTILIQSIRSEPLPRA